MYCVAFTFLPQLTNWKSKRYTIQKYKCSLLQSSNVQTKVTSLLLYILSWWWPKVGQKVLGEINNYGRFINQFPPNIIRSIQQFKRINKNIWRQKMSIMFNQIHINEEMLPKYTHTHTHTHTHIYIVFI